MQNQNGFVLQSTQPIKEIDSVGYRYLHEKTGMMLLFIKNNDDNKVFSIGFNTAPDNDTGVPHIIEHSVLCGSTKFPTKEPFVELLKGSLNTFLNAMTFSDKTMYPFASRNEQDFMNIMDIYLDAVFNPNLHITPEIFLQEGWHYHLTDKEQPLTINGVVYSEMKGAYSAPERLIDLYTERALYDNCYGFSSGGYPDAIPTLTYEQFCQFHKKYYHPSNACVYVYGDCDIDKIMEFINNSFLTKFDKVYIDSAIPMPKPVRKPRYVEATYPISDNDDETNKNYVSLSWVMKENKTETNLAFSVLQDVLFNTDAAILKQILLGSGLCDNCRCSFSDDIAQPSFSILASNVSAQNIQKIEDTIRQSLEKLVAEGIDKELLEACMNKIEFRLKEGAYGNFPRGLEYGINVLLSWGKCDDPFQPLAYSKLFKRMRANAKKDYFEKLIKKYLIDNKHNAVVVLKPEKGLGQRQVAKLEEKLENYKKSLSDEQLDEIIAVTNKLIQRQAAPDTKEQLETIPLLSLEDIDKKEKFLAIKEIALGANSLLHHNTFTSGIVYLNFMFDASCIAKEDIFYLGLLKDVMGKMSTTESTFDALSRKILINTGGIKFLQQTFTNSKNVNEHRRFITAQLKTLAPKTTTGLEILEEIICKTSFDDKNRLKQILGMVFAYSQQFMMQAGHALMFRRIGSYYSSAAEFNEMTSGLAYFQFVKQTLADFDNVADKVIEKLNQVSKTLFKSGNLTVAATCKNNELNKYQPYIAHTISHLPAGVSESVDNEFVEHIDNEAFLTPSNVQYVGQGYNYLKLGHKYSGKLAVLKTILTTDYLWNKVRVQGGAYGAMCQIDVLGNCAFVSYRDPQLDKTYQTYKEIPDYIKHFEATEREMTKYIIGTFQEVDSPKVASGAGETAIAYYFSNITKADRQKMRNQILKTTVADINKQSKIVKDVLNKKCIGTLGNAERINKSKKLFKNIVE